MLEKPSCSMETGQSCGVLAGVGARVKRVLTWPRSSDSPDPGVELREEGSSRLDAAVDRVMYRGVQWGRARFLASAARTRLPAASPTVGESSVTSFFPARRGASLAGILDLQETSSSSSAAAAAALFSARERERERERERSN